MAILSVKNLSIDYKASYGIVHAVKNVGFDIMKGESFAITGRSGSGKSSVASALMDLTSIDGGRIISGGVFYKGRDLFKMTLEEKRKIRGKNISMVFQDPQSYLNPVIRTGKQLSEAYKAHNPRACADEACEKAAEALRKVHLEDAERILASYPHQLSGGQKQRILIAMAIMNEPEILIADEPTTGLDAAVEKQILELIAKLKESMGLTLIMITHNMRIARKYCAMMAVMHEGVIIETGKTADIFANPRCEYTKLLIGG